MGTPSRAGRYRIDRLLGSGGFAAVWLGHDEDLDAPVAVKILAEHWTQREDVRERFVQEARLLRRVDSHRLVQVHDIGELDDGRPYFVMTYADRGNLEERLASGALPLDEALRLAGEIAQGVQDLHERGIVHRDLKPSNVLIRATSAKGGTGERIMLSDLGIARTEDRLSSLTLPAGSPGYMAPEQTQIDGAPDQRSDVYGLGALTYHLLTGEPPGEERCPPSEVEPAIPPAVDRVVLRALEHDRDARWPTAAAFAAALDRLNSKIDTDPPTGAAAAPDRRRRPGRRTLLAAGSAVAAAGVAAVAAFPTLGDGDGEGRASDAANAGTDPRGRWLRTDADIPAQYRTLIVQAGTSCKVEGLSPALIAAILKVESGFDPKLSDPGMNEYGIARWTPRMLMHWQPGGLGNPEPRPAQITPELSIPAIGRYLCYWGKDLADAPGDPALNLAAAYRTSAKMVRESLGVPEKHQAYMARVANLIEMYEPADRSGDPP
ncbi:serine/threonine-protein kinase [Actinomadura rugatobispora]|uniref:non-specific serine/threonine protein kinase n=1 Tax=Actinomadura rugatobispora TaxID=1994 RepID=A0ABW1A7F9_9ACTN|nr:hypothetical protein GCM10010200_084600 [Actinomadura rugatobispora]